MSFGKTKRRLQALINRKDVTDALAGDFVTEAVSDLERTLRLGAMEAIVSQSDWDGTANAFLIPAGFLEGINVFTETEELTQVDLATFLATSATSGPRVFVKMADRWLIKPAPAEGSTVYLHYYGASAPLAVDTAENLWTTSAFNAVVYQAAALAADFFQMEDQYAQRFQSRAGSYITAIQEQDHDEKWSGRLAIPLPSDRGDY